MSNNKTMINKSEYTPQLNSLHALKLFSNKTHTRGNP